MSLACVSESSSCCSTREAAPDAELEACIAFHSAYLPADARLQFERWMHQEAPLQEACRVPEAWLRAEPLHTYWASPEWAALQASLRAAYREAAQTRKQVVPHFPLILRPLQACPLPAAVRAVILGGTPYASPALACGLAFAVPPAVQQVPATLANIWAVRKLCIQRQEQDQQQEQEQEQKQKLEQEQGQEQAKTSLGKRKRSASADSEGAPPAKRMALAAAPDSAAPVSAPVPAPAPSPPRPNLLHWAQQGVLLLHTCLTTEQGAAKPHEHVAWGGFIAQVLQAVKAAAARMRPPVFLLMGKAAREIAAGVKAPAVSTSHPSMYSWDKGKESQAFKTSLPFYRVNELLQATCQQPIQW